MRRTLDSVDLAHILHYQILDPACSQREQCDKYTVEEFGIIAREVFAPEDLLVKEIASERDTSTTTRIYLCYNWKRAIPFVVKEKYEKRTTRSYTPQY